MICQYCKQDKDRMHSGFMCRDCRTERARLQYHKRKKKKPKKRKEEPLSKVYLDYIERFGKQMGEFKFNKLKEQLNKYG